ncbi:MULTISPECIES: glutaminase A [unclassified Lysobacter]|uniref:glutaminase A n=1 Tax=unclassified Lysobacter TaxID=2635362 RepID=UPI001BE67879|nr:MULTISPECIES: glutaminase A [unclassified Lysobacter]MBT2748628.1 glutaminase A [Lysobacter sp. ISL-42]MBT2751563.1 glutaminase A [Lysobacter sp. ISL-50]MBT2775757.1 glutaminase A [Lysobacter sp. ISL-54]MBT2782278.1 glutaminase A [Lysobacter sp. ISL-52]
MGSPTSTQRRPPRAGQWLAHAAALALLMPIVATAAAIPPEAEIKAAVDRAYAAARTITDGKEADYIPALAKVPAELFGIAVVTADGKRYAIGDADHPFAIESVSKPFAAAKVIDHRGPDWVRDKIGANQTGLPFNSIVALENHTTTTPAMNPLVNAGAIAIVSWIEPAEATGRWQAIQKLMSDYAGQKLKMDFTVYKSEAGSSEHNRAIAHLLKGYGTLNGDPEVALDVYTRQCSIQVTANTLATMGATFANGGTNPVTGKKVVGAIAAEKTMAAMLTTGLYETSGTWSWNVGLPAKSGVGGGIVAVAPGKLAIAAFAPPLDAAGNSVKAQKAIEMIAQELFGSGLFDTGTQSRN